MSAVLPDKIENTPVNYRTMKLMPTAWRCYTSVKFINKRSYYLAGNGVALGPSQPL